MWTIWNGFSELCKCILALENFAICLRTANTIAIFFLKNCFLSRYSNEETFWEDHQLGLLLWKTEEPLFSRPCESKAMWPGKRAFCNLCSGLAMVTTQESEHTYPFGSMFSLISESLQMPTSGALFRLFPNLHPKGTEELGCSVCLHPGSEWASRIKNKVPAKNTWTPTTSYTGQ